MKDSDKAFFICRNKVTFLPMDFGRSEWGAWSCGSQPLTELSWRQTHAEPGQMEWEEENEGLIQSGASVLVDSGTPLQLSCSMHTAWPHCFRLGPGCFLLPEAYALKSTPGGNFLEEGISITASRFDWNGQSQCSLLFSVPLFLSQLPSGTWPLRSLCHVCCVDHNPFLPIQLRDFIKRNCMQQEYGFPLPSLCSFFFVPVVPLLIIPLLV